MSEKHGSEYEAVLRQFCAVWDVGPMAALLRLIQEWRDDHRRAPQSEDVEALVEGDGNVRCPDCGSPHQIVRPGKTQPTCDCDTNCPIHGKGKIVYHPESEFWRISGYFCADCMVGFQTTDPTDFTPGEWSFFVVENDCLVATVRAESKEVVDRLRAALRTAPREGVEALMEVTKDDLQAGYDAVKHHRIGPEEPELWWTVMLVEINMARRARFRTAPTTFRGIKFYGAAYWERALTQEEIDILNGPSSPERTALLNQAKIKVGEL